MKVTRLLERTEYRIVKGETDAEVTGICFDNRKVKEGDAFICIRGALFDTHDVIKDIAKAHPSVIITDERWASEKSEKDLDEIDADIISVKCIPSQECFKYHLCNLIDLYARVIKTLMKNQCSCCCKTW